MNSLIEENKNLIYSIAKPYIKYYDIEDLFQAGALGIIKAYKKYNPRSPTKFSSFAHFYIFGEIINYIKSDRNIRPSSDYFKLYKLYITASEKLAQSLKREPSLLEISEFMEISESQLLNVINSTEFTLSLDNALKENTTFLDFLGGQDLTDEKISLKNAIEKLEELERKIINLRYNYDYSQSETAEILGISQSKVSRKEVYALKMIKKDIL